MKRNEAAGSSPGPAPLETPGRAATVNFFLVDRHCRYQWIHAPQLQDIGLDPLAMIGQDVRDVVPEDLQEPWLRHYERCRDTGASFSFFTENAVNGRINLLSVMPVDGDILTTVTEFPRVLAHHLAEALDRGGRGDCAAALGSRQAAAMGHYFRQIRAADDGGDPGPRPAR